MAPESVRIRLLLRGLIAKSWYRGDLIEIDYVCCFLALSRTRSNRGRRKLTIAIIFPGNTPATRLGPKLGGECSRVPGLVVVGGNATPESTWIFCWTQRPNFLLDSVNQFLFLNCKLQEVDHTILECRAAPVLSLLGDPGCRWNPHMHRNENFSNLALGQGQRIIGTIEHFEARVKCSFRTSYFRDIIVLSLRLYISQCHKTLKKS